MTIPPFPSQHLAKLVLGYLAEEHLMTVYDEFVQASPYLDALGNEYDRIIMTSLKNILAEYWAVKIHVETCKPFLLRKKLFQCPNLLEMVKFLIENIDVNKINDTSESKCGQSSINLYNCEVCKSLKQEICICSKRNTSVTNLQSKLHDTAPSDTSVETTSLTDLPGNHVTIKRKSIRGLDAGVTDVNDANNLAEKSVSHNDPNCVQTRVYQSSHLQNVNVGKCLDTLECKQKEEFNNILNQVCHKNQSSTNSKIQIIDSQRLPFDGYNNFATGVTGGDSGNINIPDSSTSESVHVQIPIPKENKNVPDLHTNMQLKQTRTQYLLKVANVNQQNEIAKINAVSSCSLPRLKPNIDDSKIKILSDVKVDKSYANEAVGTMNMPQVLKNATSTPLLQMQTIVINGTPVYKYKPVGQQSNYTKDEIMAMPTIILAPAAGTLQSTGHGNSMSSVSTSTATTTTLSNSARQLGPLVIDVNTGTNINATNSENVNVIEKQVETKDKPVSKIIDITSASAPKDNTVTGLTETNTPQVMPPVRKSSSTPRRTTHVRVLDFTTPRRILHESINKCPLSTVSSDAEVVISQNPNLDYPVVTNTLEKTDNVDTTTDSSKENSVKNNINKKKNWDADLRALAIINEKDVATQSKSTQKCKTVKKKKASKNEDTKKDNKKVGKKKDTEKIQNIKKASKITKEVPVSKEEVTDLPNEKVEIPIKPTINIITGGAEPDIDKNQNKSGSDNVDTPEMERISLQNEIGAKLNISDLLETPYKQVLYDIQMETPRFLGPDIAEDPLSAIKIMSIPTPRFLNDPTPSSYSSRPTDYSSGGSYYKPDDQDYMRIADDLDCAVSTSSLVDDKTEHKIADKATDTSNKSENHKEKPSRPVRQCTKNVSYYNSSTLHSKTKEMDNTSLNSSFSDTEIISHESPQINDTKISKETKSKHHNKSDKKLSSKHRKSPVKKDSLSKSFMKIKPRRPTPVKKDRKKRKTPEISKSLSRRKSTNKDANVNVAPVVVPAPTKSRRKSSTPRKLHCTKTFNSESSGHDSPELLHNVNENLAEPNIQTAPDSDTEHLPLRWSDDGSQDAKHKELQGPSNNEIEDIGKIQDYIKTVTSKNESNDGEGSLHKDLVKRGFDLETAKIIERELLDSSPQAKQDPNIRNVTVIPVVEKSNEVKNIIETKTDNVVLNKTLESDCSTGNLQIVQNDDDEDDEIELSVHECNEDSPNYFMCNYDDTKDVSYKELPRLKDKFSMEVCLDEDLSIRLRATAFTLLVDQNCEDDFNCQDQYELDMAVRSITNMDKLYTPLKKSVKAQCYDIFDSTLTSLDTPLKVNSPTEKDHEVTVTEIVLEVEKMESKEKTETKKRKRGQSGNLSDECSGESKKAKPEAQYLLNSTNIQNIDIESVLSKLHGP